MRNMRKNLINLKFGKLTPINIHSKTRNSHIRYQCLCDCGKECNVLSTHLIQKTITHCGCMKKRKDQVYNWKGCGEISHTFWKNHILRSADGTKGKRKPLEINITIEYVWELFLKQNKKCKLTNLDLTFPKCSTDKSYTASLDRIDSSKGYVKENIQWIHKDVNLMKNKYEQNYFIQMCKLIANKSCEIK